ncbi:MAG TPA: CRISPR-associated endonuclease Cas1 [Cyanobacteria bacterium UBA8803]|nr:CRISPR-associated endonuclease Cas1 [Cyanobacteria bacterium UBA9273]HBL58588.1 CRISPR-associated endonuclease Cas1 [Cyanobacteria bacterium UBA8803]
MSILFLVEQDTLVRQTDERLEVFKHKQRLIDVPLCKLEAVVIYGQVSVTAPTLRALNDRSIPVTYLSEGGRTVGTVLPEPNPNALLRSRQYKASFEADRTLAIAREFVRGKLFNQHTILARFSRKEQRSTTIEAALKSLKCCQNSLGTADSLNTLRGYEGQGAASYFGVLGELLAGTPWQFSKRTRQPPTDPVNALLGFGYALLYGDCRAAIHGVGLDPYQGFLHGERYGRANLALDLMEEFRPIFVDALVLQVLRNGQFNRESFIKHPGGGVMLVDEARKRFIMAYEERKHTKFKHPVFEMQVDYRRALILQARLLAKHLMGELDAYLPLKVR